MRRTLARTLVLIAGILVPALFGQVLTVNAATTGPSYACGDSNPAVLAAKSGPSSAPDNVAAAQASGAYKAGHDTRPASEFTGATAAERAANLALRKQWLSQHGTPSWAISHGSTQTDFAACAQHRSATGSTPGNDLLAMLTTPVYADATIGNGYGWVNSGNQQGQQTWYWCGPATVSETSYTQYNNSRLGQSNVVDQGTAASYMGTDSTNGTSASGLTNGLNNYIGIPMYGFAFYMRVDLSFSPTATERSTWASDIQWDVNQDAMTLASVMWESYNGPHLVGHPNLTTDIFHIIETLGYDWNNGNIYYADSATTVWSTVPPFSWYNNYNFVTIMGGRGYDW